MTAFILAFYFQQLGDLSALMMRELIIDYALIKVSAVKKKRRPRRIFVANASMFVALKSARH